MRYSPEQARARHANPTERLEERDSLEWAVAEAGKGNVNPKSPAIFRAAKRLAAEVKELRDENAALNIVAGRVPASVQELERARAALSSSEPR